MTNDIRHCYQDFDLKIYEDTYGAYRVEAVGLPGVRTGPVQLRLSLPQVADSVRSFQSAAAGKDVCERLGRELFKAIFQPPIRSLWYRAHQFLDPDSILRVRLDIRSSDLAGLPWELLRQDGPQAYPLALSSRSTITRCLYHMAPPPATDLPAPLRVLAVLSAPTEASVHVDHELGLLRGTFAQLIEAGVVRVDELVHPTVTVLSDTLRRGYDIFHYVGQGDFTDGVGSLALADDRHHLYPLDGHTLGGLLVDTRLRLFVLGSFPSAQPSYVDPLLWVSYASLVAGVPAVLGIQAAVSGNTMATFYGAFYRALGSGTPVELCVSHGRRAIVGRTDGGCSDWAAPVLYTNTADGRIFNPATPPRAIPTDGAIPRPVAPASLPTVLSDVPTQQNDGLIGRDAELSRILELVQRETQGSERVIVISGPVGIGSSSLARGVARIASAMGPGEVRPFAAVVCAPRQRLSPVDTFFESTADTGWGSEDLYQQIAAALQRPAMLQAQPHERWGVAAQALRENRCLVVLDDVDELRDMPFNTLLELLPPPTKLVVTTHTPLFVDGHEVHLGGLEAPDALRLWRAAARDIGAGPLATATYEELAPVIERTGGSPLAVRLLIGQLADAGLNVATAYTLLDASEPPLVTHLLRRAIGRLSEAEHEALALVALHPRPVQPAEIQATLAPDAPRALGWLTRLLRLALVWQDSEGVHLSERLRYEVLSGLGFATVRDLTRRAIDRTIEQLEAVTQIGRGHLSDAQLATALWAARRAYELREWDIVLRFRWVLDDILYRSGNWAEGIRLGELAFDASDRLGLRQARAWCAIYPIGRLYFYARDYYSSKTWCERALDLFRLERGNEAEYGTANAMRYLGRVLQVTGQPDEAAKLFEQGLGIARRLGSSDAFLNLQADLLAAVAGLAEECREYAVARDPYAQALVLYQRTGNWWGEATTEHRLGVISLETDDHEEAKKHLARSRALFERHPWPVRHATVLYTQAMLAMKLGDAAQAEGLLRLARDELVHLPAPRELALVDAALARYDVLSPLQGPLTSSR